MRLLKSLIFGLVLLGLASTGFATESESNADDLGAVDVVGTPCQDRLDAILAGTAFPLSITHLPYRHAGGALKHYREDVLRGETEFEVHISEASEFQDKNGRGLGRKVSITDGGDESLVAYVYDHRRKLVSAFWHSQSPVRYWFCRR